MRTAMVVNMKNGMALHRQVYEEWRKGILTGRFRPGDQVPSSRELAATLGISRSTVTEAYEQLVAEGYFESAHGSGTFVCREIPDELFEVRRVSGAGATHKIPVPLSRYSRELHQALRYPAVIPGVIQFSGGRPDLDHFPLDTWRKLLVRHLQRPRRDLFDYAQQSAGYEPLRREVAASLARSRAVRCDWKQVVIANGSQQGLDLCVRLLLEPGDAVAIENPGYLGARRAFRACGAKLLPARVDAQGIVVDDLAKRTRLVYVTPSHQFPTGVSMSLARRLELIEWARRSGAVVVEDDYSSEFRYGGAPLPALQGLASDVAVIYLGTFSKIMFPGLRIGYLVLPPELVEPFTRAKWLVDRQTPVLEQAALADFIREGFLERHIRRMRRLYGRRRQVMVEAIDRYFGNKMKVVGDAAGMHLLARFDSGDVLKRARQNRVDIRGARVWYLNGPSPHELVLGFSELGERTIREAMRRLAS
jgi:GntR family transcriptional regulator / MocR family aminotransferase